VGGIVGVSSSAGLSMGGELGTIDGSGLGASVGSVVGGGVARRN
jgi:hypothetical protein